MDMGRDELKKSNRNFLILANRWVDGTEPVYVNEQTDSYGTYSLHFSGFNIQWQNAIMQHDCAFYTYECIPIIINGTRKKNTNIPMYFPRNNKRYLSFPFLLEAKI